PRISGVVMIDPFAYRTSGYGWRHLLYRLARRTLRFLKVYDPGAPRLTSGAAESGDGGMLIKYKYIEPAESSRILRTLISRNARLHFIYTGGVRESFNHPGQLQKMFPDVDFRGLVTLDYLPHLEHTQMLEEDRRTMVHVIERWFDSHLRTAAPAA